MQLEEGVEGLIHISQLSRRRVESPQEVLQEGQEVTARILEVNAEGRRIRLSLSALQPPEEGERERRPQNDEPRRRRHEPDRSRTPDFAQEETNVTLGDLWQDVIK